MIQANHSNLGCRNINLGRFLPSYRSNLRHSIIKGLRPLRPQLAKGLGALSSVESKRSQRRSTIFVMLLFALVPVGVDSATSQPCVPLGDCDELVCFRSLYARFIADRRHVISRKHSVQRCESVVEGHESERGEGCSVLHSVLLGRAEVRRLEECLTKVKRVRTQPLPSHPSHSYLRLNATSLHVMGDNGSEKCTKRHRSYSTQ